MHIVVDRPDDEPALPTASIAALVEAVREALTNVAKHAGTTTARVTVRPADRGVAVDVVDAGRGYDLASTPARVGQSRSIRQRIDAVGGRVDIESSPGSGTRVRLWAPVEEATR